MKKMVLCLILLLLLPVVSGAEQYPLKLRTSYNPGYLRIVLESSEEIITRALVNQKGQNILVTFPGINFTIQEEKATVTYKKKDKDTLMFSPGDFSGLKVLTLKNPNRLVIDVYQEGKKNPPSPPFAKVGDTGSPPLEKRDAGGFSDQKKGAMSKTIIIDPGHGGFESGIVKDDNEEKKTVLDIARKLNALAEQGSFKSSLTRSSDLFMGQSERVKYTNGKGADIFISLHVGNHRDMVIYIPVITEHASDTVKPYLFNKGQEEYLKKTVALLNALKEAAAANLGNDMVRVKPLPYSILSKIEAAALMIELPSFEYANYNEEYKTLIASTLNKGLYLYEENEAK